MANIIPLHRQGLSLIIITGILILAACSLPEARPVNPVITPSYEIQAIQPIIQKTQFPVVSQPVPGITPTPTLLRFSFPTPGQAPVSAWRPPLYPIPWGLGPNDHFYFTRPITANVVNWALADYRYGYFFPGTSFIHSGIDIDAPRETPILASAPGKVVSAGLGLYYSEYNPKDPYGLAVTIRHDFGYSGTTLYTIYAHMDRVDVHDGQIVSTGTPLGIVGNTGLTTGPHLHFEIRTEKNTFWSARNPELWLAPPQGQGVLVGRVMHTEGKPLYGQEARVIHLATRQKWDIMTYGDWTVNMDDYFQENLVLGDLPAGEYEISMIYDKEPYPSRFTILPGAITTITFRGKQGYSFVIPPTPSPKQWLTIGR